MNKLIFITIIAFIFTLNSCDDRAEKENEDREAYLTEHKITVEPTASGLYYVETKKGFGEKPVMGDKVSVKYKGMFLNGTIFDKSDKPVSFTLGSVIDGWNEGLTYMREGGKATLVCPSALAYGSQGNNRIPGYSTLVFEVELIEIER